MDAIILCDTNFLGRVRPLGAYRIADHLRQNGYEAIVVDFLSDLFESKQLFSILRTLITKETKFVGYSSSLFHIRQVGFKPTRETDEQNDNDEDLPFLTVTRNKFKALNTFIKMLNPNTKIVFGGANSRDLVKYNLLEKDNLGVEYAFHGYSETMVIDFVESIKDGRKPQCSKEYNGLAEIEFASKGEGFDFYCSNHRWHPSDVIQPGESLTLETSRGCIFKCKFCAYPLIGKDPRDDSYIRTADVLYDELKKNYEEYGTTKYLVIDDTFNERIEKMERLCRVRDRLGIDLLFAGYIRIDLLARKQQEQLPLLKDMNFHGMFVGIETLNHKAAQIIGKGMHPDEVKEMLYKIKDYYNNNVHIGAGFIAGLPKESPESFLKNMEWVLRFDTPIDHMQISTLGLHTTSHTQSEFSANPSKYGYITKTEGLKTYWKNEFWNEKQAREITDRLVFEAWKSGRNKPGSFASLGMTALGYDYYDVAMKSANKLDMVEFNKRDKKFKQQYASNLISYIENDRNNHAQT